MERCSLSLDAMTYWETHVSCSHAPSRDWLLSPFSDMDEHKLNLEEIQSRFNVEVSKLDPMRSPGLTEEEAKRRLLEDGLNELQTAPKKSNLRLFLSCFLSLFNCLLLCCAALSFVVGFFGPEYGKEDILTAAILVLVIIVISIIEFLPMYKSNNVLSSFSSLVPEMCTVIREQKSYTISTKELVKGDVVLIKMGDMVAADLYIFSCVDLKVNNSSLTGESEPQMRNTNQNQPDSYLEASNLAFNSSPVMTGEGYGIVIRTGDQTMIGQIASMTQKEEKRASPLSSEITGFVQKVFGVAVFMSALMIIHKFTKESENMLQDSVKIFVSVLLAWVPQGLPLTVTVLLSLTGKKMVKENVLTKNSHCIETLGAITLLATDKTGTLTKNQMTVSTIYTHEELSFPFDEKDIKDIVVISAVCSSAKFNDVSIEPSKREIIADATEQGLTRFAIQHSDFDKLCADYPKLEEFPFNSDTKVHISLHKFQDTFVAFMKGAPERVFAKCSTTQEQKENFLRANKNMALMGHRVIAFAKKQIQEQKIPEEFEFVGLVSLGDPPKHGVREAIGKCRMAGIKVIMVTGDQPLTAISVSCQINLFTQKTIEERLRLEEQGLHLVSDPMEQTVVIRGDQIDSLTMEQWDWIFDKDEIVFARTSPKHKLTIVKNAQARGHIVGVTGDGVNDSPALKKADLGIAMNHSGSAVSKESASMILLNDNFASVVCGIKQGRLVFINLKKSVRYLLSHIVPEGIPFIIQSFYSGFVAMKPIHILMIDVLFEMFVATSFSWESENDNVMKLPPRRPAGSQVAELLLRKNEFNSKLINADEEQGDLQVPLTLMQKLKGLLTLEYWVLKKDFIFADMGESLVDTSTLTYSYLEAGILITVGSYVSTLYVKNEQKEAAFFWSVIIMQAFNVFACKSRLRSPLSTNIFSNIYSFILIFVGFAMIFALSFIEALEIKVDPAFLWIPILSGFVLFFYAVVRFHVLNLIFPIEYSPEPIGLQMHPTRWSRS